MVEMFDMLEMVEMVERVERVEIRATKILGYASSWLINTLSQWVWVGLWAGVVFI